MKTKAWSRTWVQPRLKGRADTRVESKLGRESGAQEYGVRLVVVKGVQAGTSCWVRVAGPGHSHAAGVDPQAGHLLATLG